MNFLILATAANSEAVKRLQYEAKKRGHAVQIVNPMDLFLLISNSESGYDRLYQAQRGKVTRINIKDFDAVLPRLGENTAYGAFLVEHLNKNQRIFSTNTAEGIRNASNQLKTLQLLSSSGIPTPKTVFAQNPNHIEHLVERVGGYPVICKLLHGSGGSGVSLLKDRKTAIPILQSLFKSRSSVVIQEFLDGGYKDYRAVVIMDRVVAIMERTAAKGDFRANLKQNGIGRPVQLSEEDQLLCVNAARATGLYTAGVDLIKSNGKSYIIEVNANWGWESEKITGVNVAEIMILFCEQNYQAKNIEKSQVLNYQRQLFEERMRNEYLTKHINALNDNLKFFTGDKNINQLYKKARGNKVIYKDRDSQNKEIRVQKMQDLFLIMKDSFTIK